MAGNGGEDKNSKRYGENLKILDVHKATLVDKNFLGDKRRDRADVQSLLFSEIEAPGLVSLSFEQQIHRRKFCIVTKTHSDWSRMTSTS